MRRRVLAAITGERVALPRAPPARAECSERTTIWPWVRLRGSAGEGARTHALARSRDSVAGGAAVANMPRQLWMWV